MDIDHVTDWPEGGAADFVPDDADLAELRKAAEGCRGCPLYRLGSQTVFGEGPADAAIVMVGEAPGDYEDRSGRPFVGPAGQLFDRALAAADLARETLYITNAVKHFKWVAQRGRRIVQKPAAPEIRACRPWLEAELGLIRPRVLVCLGAVAAGSLLGPQVKVTRDRGKRLDSPWAPATFVTVHPSAVLRMPDEDLRARSFDELVADLKIASALAR
jgi:DNA polymerase